MQLGKEFGLEGEKLLEFVREQQTLEEEKEGKDVRKKRGKRDADIRMKTGKRDVRKEKLGNYNMKLTS